jgi:hypothetical protein
MILQVFIPGAESPRLPPESRTDISAPLKSFRGVKADIPDGDVRLSMMPGSTMATRTPKGRLAAGYGVGDCSYRPSSIEVPAQSVFEQVHRGRGAPCIETGTANYCI